MPTDHTLEEVGKQFDVTRDGSSIEAKRYANCVMRRSEHLQSLLEND